MLNFFFAIVGPTVELRHFSFMAFKRVMKDFLGGMEVIVDMGTKYVELRNGQGRTMPGDLLLGPILI